MWSMIPVVVTVRPTYSSRRKEIRPPRLARPCEFFAMDVTSRPMRSSQQEVRCRAPNPNEGGHGHEAKHCAGDHRRVAVEWTTGMGPEGRGQRARRTRQSAQRGEGLVANRTLGQCNSRDANFGEV